MLVTISRTCLVVDDSRVVRTVSRRLLEERGFEVDEAADGLEALAWCRAGMPRAILLDWNMPVMNGIEFLRTLRTEPGGDEPVVIICSERNELEDIVEALAAGADEYLMKPFDGEILSGKLEETGL
jgi:two-component system chemotaxis response regulator CheY